MLFNLLGFAIFDQFASDEAKEAAVKAFNQAMIMLLGIGVVIIGVVFIVGGSRAASSAAAIGEVIATKGASLAK